MLHLKKMGYPNDEVEIIIVDDGSNPPIPEASYFTGNTLAWTQGLGRNLGVSHAKGEYLFLTDLDHILSKEAIEDALNFTGNRMNFRRKIAILDENGDIKQDKETLKDWGYEREHLEASVHGNTFVMPKSIFDELGGYDTRHSTWGYHPSHQRGDDCAFNQKWRRKYRELGITTGRDIYLFPLGRFHKDGNLNTKGLFHDLSQSKQEKFYKT